MMAAAAAREVRVATREVCIAAADVQSTVNSDVSDYRALRTVMCLVMEAESLVLYRKQRSRQARGALRCSRE